MTPTYDPATQTATWNLSGIAIEDGYYRATLQATGIRDVAGNLLAGGNYPIDFFRLLGDTDGNARVDIFDVANVQVNYGQASGMSPAEGDFDGTGRWISSTWRSCRSLMDGRWSRRRRCRRGRRRLASPMAPG